MREKRINYHRSINYYETDQMGIVHHSNYIRFFEETRLFQMKRLGMDYMDLEGMGIIIPVTFVECSYLVPLHFEDQVEIVSKLAKYNGIKMEMTYEIYLEGTDQLCTRGRTGHCFLNRELKPIRMKREFPDLYAKLKGLVEES